VYITGRRYVVAATEKKEWYMWGSGVLGVFKYPTKLTFLSGADYVTVGYDFGLFVRSGQVWVWGCNSWGELGVHS
jgi:alpha-tubulin suppressor-like RCC1 family protein